MHTFFSKLVSGAAALILGIGNLFVPAIPEKLPVIVPLDFSETPSQEITPVVKNTDDKFYTIDVAGPEGMHKLLVAKPNGKTTKLLDVEHYSKTKEAVSKTKLGNLGGGDELDRFAQDILEADEEMKNYASLGATNAIETPVALFSTSLANSITAAATTMTLVSATTKDGTTLASSTYSFIIDEGTASEEFVKADCTATACTNMERGLSVVTGTTTVAGLAKTHRRAASVKITDAPILLNLTRIINGIGTLPNKISYTTAPTFTSGNDIVTKTYVDGVALAGAPVCSESVNGVCRLATKLNQASSTPSTASIGYVLQAQNATSTYNAGAAGGNGLNVVVTDNSNKISNQFIATSSTDVYKWGATHTFSNGLLATASSTFSATTSIAASSVTNNALCVNGVCHAFPSSGLASSTVWAFNASGVATYSHIQSYDAGVTATTTGVGNLVISHGLGAIPKMVKLTVLWDGTSSVDSSGHMYGVATSTNTNAQNVIGRSSSSNASASADYLTNGLILDQRDSNGGTEAQATLSAWTSTTFTINFTTHSSRAKQILWEAYQ